AVELAFAQIAGPYGRARHRPCASDQPVLRWRRGAAPGCRSSAAGGAVDHHWLPAGGPGRARTVTAVQQARREPDERLLPRRWRPVAGENAQAAAALRAAR